MNDINLETIDVKLLKKQKLALVDLASQLTRKYDKPIVEILDGVINLLYYIQDAMELDPEAFDAIHNGPRKDDLIFNCPACDVGRHLDQVARIDTEITRILHIRHDGEMTFGTVRTEGQNGVDEYRCAECGHVIEDKDGDPITEDEELAKWLKAQPYNKKQRTVKR